MDLQENKSSRGWRRAQPTATLSGIFGYLFYLQIPYSIELEFLDDVDLFWLLWNIEPGPMPDTLSPKERQLLLRTLKTLPAVLEEVRVILDVPTHILPANTKGDRAIALMDWAKSDIGCGQVTLKRKVDETVADYKSQSKQQQGSQYDEKPEQLNRVHPLLVEPSDTLAKDSITEIFAQFEPNDFADLQRAFLRAFEHVMGATFRQVRPDHPPFFAPESIQKALEMFGNQCLVVRFVEFALAEIERSHQGRDRDLTQLQQLLDRLAHQYGIELLTVPVASKPTAQQAYLLISVQEMGLETEGIPSVNLFTELHVTGVREPLEFGDDGAVTCPLNQVEGYVSHWIRSAEDELLAYGFSRVTVEVFLSYRYLDLDVGEKWTVQNKRNRPRPFGKHRAYLIRSLERALDQSTQLDVEQRWTLLEDCVQEKTVSEKFLLQAVCPDIGDLENVNAPGLKLVAQLPGALEQRREILCDVVYSGVPIVLWSADNGSCSQTERIEVFDGLLRDSCLTDFADLAYQWQEQRKTKDEVNQSLRLLCDRPDRWPSLPTDADPLIAI